PGQAIAREAALFPARGTLGTQCTTQYGKDDAAKHKGDAKQRKELLDGKGRQPWPRQADAFVARELCRLIVNKHDACPEHTAQRANPRLRGSEGASLDTTKADGQDLVSASGGERVGNAQCTCTDQRGRQSGEPGECEQGCTRATEAAKEGYTPE